MKQLNCETCGAPLTISENGLFAKCEVCGNVYEYRNPKEEFCIAQLNEANDLRQHMDFDDAIKKYRAILKTEKEDAEVWWGLLLSTYGVEYVKDPFTGRYIPTFHRNKRGNILENEAALMTIQYATDNQKDTYFTQLKELRRIQEGIESIANKCEPYDVFISFKATDQEGRKTEDRDIAFNIYDELNSKGIKTFFSEVTLRGMASSDFEAVIFNALNTCKVFILVGTSKENINSTWVKNEWTRFRDTVREDIKLGVKAPSHFAVVGRDMNPSDLPAIFNKTQNVMLKNYAGDGYTKDIALSVCNILGISEKERELARKKAEEESKKALEKEREERERWQKEQEEKLKNLMQSQSASNVSSVGNVATTDSLLERMFIFLEDKDWESAENYTEKVLDINPRCAEAYLGKLLIDLKLTNRAKLGSLLESFTNNANYSKMVRYASQELKNEINGYLAQIKENIRLKKLDEVYNACYVEFSKRERENDLSGLIISLMNFKSFNGYKNSKNVVENCTRILDRQYNNAMSLMQSKNYEDAIEVFNTIVEYKDVNRQLLNCKALLTEQIYNNAIIGMNNKQYLSAMDKLKKIMGYKNASDLYRKCEDAIAEIKYQDALSKMNEKDYPNAIKIFNEIINYKDSKAKKKECRKIIYDPIRIDAENALNEKNWDKALELFNQLLKVSYIQNTYKPYVDCINEIKTRDAKKAKSEKRKSSVKDVIYKLRYIMLVAVMIIVITVPCVLLPLPLDRVGDFRVKKLTNELAEYNINDGYMIKSYVGKEDDVVIPSEVKGVPVVAVPRGFCKKITPSTITIPEGVLYYGGNGSNSLRKVNLPKSLKYLGSFEYCYALQEMIMPENVEKFETFHACKSLKKVVLSDKITSLKDGVFAGCESLTSINLDKVTRLGNGVFNGCKSLESITLSEGTTSVSGSLFYGCKALKEVNLPSTITTIGDSAFAECDSLESLTVPDGVTSIGAGAFDRSEKLKYLSIPNTVETIGTDAFEFCGLTTINYRGTMDEWKNNVKFTNSLFCVYDVSWIVCTDGTIRHK